MLLLLNLCSCPYQEDVLSCVCTPVYSNDAACNVAVERQLVEGYMLKRMLWHNIL